MLDLIVVCECMFQISRASVYIRKVSSEFSGMNLIAIVIEGHDKVLFPINVIFPVSISPRRINGRGEERRKCGEARNVNAWLTKPSIAT